MIIKQTKQINNNAVNSQKSYLNRVTVNKVNVHIIILNETDEFIFDKGFDNMGKNIFLILSQVCS